MVEPRFRSPCHGPVPLLRIKEIKEVQEKQRSASCETYDIATPLEASRETYSRPEPRTAGEPAAAGEDRMPPKSGGSSLATRRRFFTLLSGRALAVSVVALVVLLSAAGVSWQVVGPHNGSSARTGADAFEELHSTKLQNITAGVVKLSELYDVVVKADATYDEVYHNQLVQHSGVTRVPEERDWNDFVQDARVTAPVFLDGKERLRDAVANMHRLIRRAPDFLRSLVHWLRQGEMDEVAWYMAKVARLIDAIHISMEGAAEKFGAVNGEIDGMARDARDNENHLQSKASALEGEAVALESTPPARSGSWVRSTDSALYGCELQRSHTTMEDCKMGCLRHGSAACSRITYYKTASRNNCFLHCESASAKRYREADTYILERSPEELAVDVATKREQGLMVSDLRQRWHAVQQPLREVTQLVRRFRGATADLRKSIEEVRFAIDDLRAVSTLATTERQIRLVERRVGDLVAAVEDLGASLAPLRFAQGE